MRFSKKNILIFLAIAIICLGNGCSVMKNNKLTNKMIDEEISNDVRRVDIQIYCNPELNSDEVQAIENKIQKHENIATYREISKKEAFEKVEELLGTDKNLLEGMDESFLPIGFKIQLKDIKLIDNFYNEFKNEYGVDKVLYYKK